MCGASLAMGGGSWGDKFEVKVAPFKESSWKKCPDDVDEKRKYSVDEKNTRIATKIDIGDSNFYCTIIGNTALSLNKVTSWSIKILETKHDGRGIWIGVAPSDIDQNGDYNFIKCGWYFGCYISTLHSGPPHKYDGKKYGPRKGDGKYIHTGDSVDVAIDTSKGELSFVVDGVNLGVAFDGIPLDKPLVPCVLLFYDSDSVELVLPEVSTETETRTEPKLKNAQRPQILFSVLVLLLGVLSYFAIQMLVN